MTVRELYVSLLESILKGTFNGNESVRVFRAGADTETDAAVNIKHVSIGKLSDGSKVALVHTLPECWAHPVKPARDSLLAVFADFA